MYGDYALSGSIFLDSRCRCDLQEDYLLLYGHHMEKHQMFGDLESYLQQEFFEAHQTGTLLLPGETYDLKIFAVMTADASDAFLFDPVKAARNQTELLDKITKYALHQRKDQIAEIRKNKSQILALSTCSGERLSDRTVVLAEMIQRDNRGAEQT